MGKEKPEPEPKPEPIDPVTGKGETEAWREKVLGRLDALGAKVDAQGKAIQEWGQEPEPEPKPTPPSPPNMSAPPGKRAPLDEFSG